MKFRCRAVVDGRPCGAPDAWHYVRGLGCVCSDHLPRCVVCGVPTTGLRLTTDTPVCIAHSHLSDAALLGRRGGVVTDSLSSRPAVARGGPPGAR